MGVCMYHCQMSSCLLTTHKNEQGSLNLIMQVVYSVIYQLSDFGSHNQLSNEQKWCNGN